MTETQTPNPDCPECGGTGFVPPFMDQCACPVGFLAAVDATAEAFAAERIPARGTMTSVLRDDGTVGTQVWTGTAWVPVGTEALTPAEYHAKYPTRPPMAADVAAAIDELADEADAWDVAESFIAADEAEAAALAAAAADVDEVDAEAEFEVVHTIDVVNQTVAATIADEIIDHYGEDAIVAAVEAVADDDGEADLGDVLEAVERAKPKTSKDTFAALVDACEAIPTPVKHDGCPDCAGMGYTEPDDPTISVECVTCRGTGLHPSRLAPAPKVKVKTAHTMSPPQDVLLTRLLAERDPANAVVAAIITELATCTVDKKRASKLIDFLMKIPADPARKADRPNNYDGACKDCGGQVEAQAGVIRKDTATGRWVTHHKPGECLSAEAKAALEADRVTEPGLYRRVMLDPVKTDVFRVRKARTSDRLYGEKVCPYPDGTVAFAYNGKAMSFLRSSDKLTWQEARDFGCAYGACIACGRTLSDARSLVQGYGNTCAGHYRWPTVTIKQAEAIIAGSLTWEDVVSIGL